MIKVINGETLRNLVNALNSMKVTKDKIISIENNASTWYAIYEDD